MQPAPADSLMALYLKIRSEGEKGKNEKRNTAFPKRRPFVPMSLPAPLGAT